MKISPHIKIKEIRTLRGFSQQYMAEKLELSQMAYSKIENNVTQLNWDKLNRISQILSINIWDLIDNEKELDEHNFDDKSPGEVVLLLKQLFVKQECQLKTLKEEVSFLRDQLKSKD